MTCHSCFCKESMLAIRQRIGPIKHRRQIFLYGKIHRENNPRRYPLNLNLASVLALLAMLLGGHWALLFIGLQCGFRDQLFLLCYAILGIEHITFYEINYRSNGNYINTFVELPLCKWNHYTTCSLT